jgi:glycosyltransferase involved in cell wall biosynthesis
MKEDINQKVSIITPVYNSASFLKATLESVLIQTYRDWELITVDDCSTDKSLDILREFESKDSRIKILRLNKNQGQINARNKALNLASGRYIAFLDSDDIWRKEKLEKQINFLKRNDATIVHSFYDYIDETGQGLDKIIKAPYEIQYKQLLNTNYLGCLTVIYDVLKAGKQSMPYVGKRDDWACWLHILRQGHSAFCIPEVLASYRVRNNSLSSNKIKTIQYNWGILRNDQGLSILKASYHFSINIILSIKKYYLI